ncbi:TPA: hypothetical protein CPT94_07315 [Candidatus Gastranaerophilales bacterium HUM_22]|jgi:hypothetical protein|nr:MAG TPA: hypothetical protein CPT94_07315 [Candidatus Gastranaerophilales bacterium HUM_22]
MTNPMYSSQPNYSGVTIQIANPAVYAGGGGMDRVNSYGVSQPQICPNNNYYPQPQNAPAVYTQQEALPSYPPQYYLNNYNYQNNGTDARKNKEASAENGLAAAQTDSENAVKQYEPDIEEPQDFSKSKAVIDDLDARAAAEAEEKKNSKQKRVVALTDEYIKSLENYLNNPNDEIRLMASKEILTRLDEDKDRYNDAALNALLNKMLQDPSKLIRVAALSAFASQLASGNDYTITLLHNIQQNPSADKEDVLQAADILLKMSAGTEVKNIPNPAVKETPDNDEGQKQ